MQAILSAAGVALVVWLTLAVPSFFTLIGASVVAYAIASSIYSKAAHMSTRRKLMLATWSAPSEPAIYGLLNINADPLKAFLDKAKAAGDRLTVTTAVAKAAALAFRYSPNLNCRLAFDTFHPKDRIDVSCLVNLNDGKDLALVLLQRADTKPLKELTAELTAKADKLRTGRDDDFNKSKPLLSALPVCVLRPLVAFTGYLSSALELNIPALGVRASPAGTCMITSVGSMGVQQGFAPFTPFMRTPMLLAVGAIEKRAVVVTADDGTDKVVVQNQLSLTATIDHRYADGAEIAKLGLHLKKLLEHPHLLDAPADVATPNLPKSKRKSTAAAGAGAAEKKD